MPQVIPVVWITELQLALWSFLGWLGRKPKAMGPHSINTVTITSTLELAQRIYVLKKQELLTM